MKISLIDYTGKGHQDHLYAARILAYTKNTRLNMTPDGLNAFMVKPAAEILDELKYMSSSIASSWEFVDLTFSINNVSRACAQQITRTRTASFAMQSQRVNDMSKVSVHVPPGMKNELRYKLATSIAIESYGAMVAMGESLEDARGVLPMNVHSTLLAKYNLRAWVDLVRARSSLRVQDEYREVIEQMKSEVINVWPWVSIFLQPKQAQAIAIIEELANHIVPHDLKMKLAKAADLLKKDSA